MNVMASYAKWTLLPLLLCGLFTSGFMTPRSENGDQRQRVLTYTRDMLLALRDSGAAPPIERLDLTNKHLDNNIQQTRLRKRGRKGGVRQRLRIRTTRPPLPSMSLSNTRSLKPKMDELRRQANVCYELREACVMTITETWLNKDISDSILEIGGFSLIRADRDEHSGKGKGEASVCQRPVVQAVHNQRHHMYVNDQWCRQHTTKDIMCTSTTSGAGSTQPKTSVCTSTTSGAGGTQPKTSVCQRPVVQAAHNQRHHVYVNDQWCRQYTTKDIGVYVNDQWCRRYTTKDIGVSTTSGAGSTQPKTSCVRQRPVVQAAHNQRHRCVRQRPVVQAVHNQRHRCVNDQWCRQHTTKDIMCTSTTSGAGSTQPKTSVCTSTTSGAGGTQPKTSVCQRPVVQAAHNQRHHVYVNDQWCRQYTTKDIGVYVNDQWCRRYTTKDIGVSTTSGAGSTQPKTSCVRQRPVVQAVHNQRHRCVRQRPVVQAVHNQRHRCVNDQWCRQHTTKDIMCTSTTSGAGSTQPKTSCVRQRPVVQAVHNQRHRCVNDQWCRQYTTKAIICNPDVELLCLSLRPFTFPVSLGMF